MAVALPIATLSKALKDINKDEISEAEARTMLKSTMNTKPWPTHCNKTNGVKDMYNYGDVPWNWVPPSKRNCTVADPDNPAMFIKVPGYQNMCKCSHQWCARYVGDPKLGLDPGPFFYIYEHPSLMDRCMLASSYCKSCYKLEYDRCKVAAGAHNGKHAEGQAAPHQALSEDLANPHRKCQTRFADQSPGILH